MASFWSTSSALSGLAWSLKCLLVVLLSWRIQAGRLYSKEDPLTILSSDTLKETLLNSSTAWLVQFYSSWCGHCIQYSPTWKALAGDVKGEWPWLSPRGSPSGTQLTQALICSDAYTGCGYINYQLLTRLASVCTV